MTHRLPLRPSANTEKGRAGRRQEATQSLRAAAAPTAAGGTAGVTVGVTATGRRVPAQGGRACARARTHSAGRGSPPPPALAGPGAFGLRGVVAPSPPARATRGIVRPTGGGGRAQGGAAPPNGPRARPPNPPRHVPARSPTAERTRGLRGADMRTRSLRSRDILRALSWPGPVCMSPQAGPARPRAIGGRCAQAWAQGRGPEGHGLQPGRRARAPEPLRPTGAARPAAAAGQCGGARGAAAPRAGAGRPRGAGGRSGPGANLER